MTDPNHTQEGQGTNPAPKPEEGIAAGPPPAGHETAVTEHPGHGRQPHAVIERPGGLPFSPEEIDALHAEDRSAGAAIVLLMSGVFVIGLLMYLYIAWIVG